MNKKFKTLIATTALIGTLTVPTFASNADTYKNMMSNAHQMAEILRSIGWTDSEISFLGQQYHWAKAQLQAETANTTATTSTEVNIYDTFTEAEIVRMSGTAYAEARGSVDTEIMKVVWCALNRVDDSRFPNTLMGVLTQSNQFAYVSNTEYRLIVEDVLTRYIKEKNGESVTRELPKGYCWFTGDGKLNHYRNSF